MKTQSCTLALGVIYLVSGIGASGTNLDRLHEVVEFLGMLECPWILLGDFNMEPLELHQCGFCE
eukprot:3724171-Pyramimonas_sp.AAC.1